MTSTLALSRFSAIALILSHHYTLVCLPTCPFDLISKTLLARSSPGNITRNSRCIYCSYLTLYMCTYYLIATLASPATLCTRSNLASFVHAYTGSYTKYFLSLHRQYVNKLVTSHSYSYTHIHTLPSNKTFRPPCNNWSN